MWKPQKTMSNIAVLTWERWIKPESCTPERVITLADLKEIQCRGNTLFLNEDFGFGSVYYQFMLKLLCIYYHSPHVLISSCIHYILFCEWMSYIISFACGFVGLRGTQGEKTSSKRKLLVGFEHTSFDWQSSELSITLRKYLTKII